MDKALHIFWYAILIITAPLTIIPFYKENKKLKANLKGLEQEHANIEYDYDTVTMFEE